MERAGEGTRNCWWACGAGGHDAAAPVGPAGTSAPRVCSRVGGGDLAILRQHPACVHRRPLPSWAVRAWGTSAPSHRAQLPLGRPRWGQWDSGAEGITEGTSPVALWVLCSFGIRHLVEALDSATKDPGSFVLFCFVLGLNPGPLLPATLSLLFLNFKTESH